MTGLDLLLDEKLFRKFLA